MSDRFFLDSNICLYLFDTDSKKAEIASNLFITNTFISTQVIAEIANVLTKKFLFKKEDVIESLRFIGNKAQVKSITLEVLDNTFSVFIRYGFSFYDSMIIAAALDSNCSILYSEDMQHQQIIENKLSIINPFI